MGFTKKTITDIDIAGKRLLIRVDYSVEIDAQGDVVDDTKLRATLPTIHYALEQGAAVVLCSHLGRPEGVSKPELSLFPVAKRLRSLLERDVEFVPECVGERAEKVAGGAQPGQVVLLENLRFDAREEANDDGFAAELAKLADVFVQDGFAVAYRSHASISAITRHIQSVAGLLLEREVSLLSEVYSEGAPQPRIAIVGGISVAEKVHVIERAIAHADVLVLGGPLATVFLHEMGVKTGKSPIVDADAPLARELLDRVREQRRGRGFTLVVPQDAVVAKRDDSMAELRIVDWSAHVIADIEAHPKRATHEASQTADDELILDIGPFTGAFVAGLVQFAGTVLWSGVLGDVTTSGHSNPVGPFAHGSELVIEALTGQFGRKPARVIVAGDDTADFIRSRGMTDAFDLVSTGGGASDELLGGRTLVGVDVLEDK